MPTTQGSIVGLRARFFHPRTFGVMHYGTVEKVHRDGSVTVRFDVHFNGRHSFRTSPDFNV